MKMPIVRKRHRGEENMGQIELQLEFVKGLYLLKRTLISISESAEFWIKENEGSIPFSHRLMKSPLALRTVRDLIYWLWDVAGTLEEYVDDSHRDAFRSIHALYTRNVKERRRAGELDIFEPESRALDLEALQQAARTLYEIVDDAFEESFLELPWPGDECALDAITRELRLVDKKLEEKLYWLGAVLDDLGKVMATDDRRLSKKATTKPTSHINELRRRANEKLN
jgi:hypothetical protein